MENNIVDRFIESQFNSWENYRNNVRGLRNVLSHTITVGRLQIMIQYNPERVHSTAADISPQTIRRRKCFLCSINRPPGQDSLDLHGYHILVNPYPIFEKHIVLAKNEHVPQSLAGEMENMLILSRELNEYTVFYNGPHSGASAPDHMHFQAFPKGLLPIMREDCGNRELLSNKNTEVYGMDDGLRKCIIVEGRDKTMIRAIISEIFKITGSIEQAEVEPRMNAFAEYYDGKFKVIIVLRDKHRPWQFYSEENNILFSPGAVDVAGIVVTVRQKDYENLNMELLADLFSQVIIDEKKWSELKEKIKRI